MMTTETAFKNLGLSRNEMEVYSFLLRRGPSFGADVYKLSKMDKSSVYRALNNLMKSGLIYSTGETKNQKFVAFPVDVLFSKYAKKKEEFEQTEQALKSFVENIESYVAKNYKKTNVKVFEGEQGYKDFLEERLADGVDEILQLAPLKKRISVISDFYEYIDEHIKKRVKKNIPIKVMFDATVQTDHLDRTRPEILKEARQIPESLRISASLHIFGDKVGVFSEKSGSFIAIVIDDPLIADLMRAMFYFIWERAEVVF